jgi:L-lactate dehydrogenase complex protein LldG
MQMRDEMHKKLLAALRTDSAVKPLKSELDSLFLPPGGRNDGVSVDDMVKRYCAALKQADGEPHVFDSRESFIAWFEQLALEVNPQRVILASDPVVSSCMQGASASMGLNAVDFVHVPVEEEGREADMYLRRRTADAQIGIGMALAGFADSGAIAIASTMNESRALSLLVDIHIAILPASRILPCLDAFADEMTRIARDGDSSALTIVGGPSKTADIEKVLVTGIHGPGKLIAAVMRDM